MVNPSMIEVAEALGLGPFRRAGREWVCKATWRGGDGWNIALNDERGVWTDRTGKTHGGGPCQLAESVMGEAEGRRWFRERYGRCVLRQPKGARRVPVVAHELLRRVVAALADVMKQVVADDEPQFMLWANIDRIARAGGAEWRRFRERVEIDDPELYRHWLKCAVEFEADTRQAAALVVAMLSEVAA